VYAEPTEPAGFPIPSPFDNGNDKYSDAVVVDQLPNSIIQHVRKSNNQELKAALDPTNQQEQKVRSTGQSQANTLKLKTQSSKVSHHKARPKYKVKRSRPLSPDDYDSITETSNRHSSFIKVIIIYLIHL